MLNHVDLMGRLVADPELRTTPQGVPVCSLRLACDRDYKNKQTNERETDFINVIAWRSTAEFVAKHFTKGRMAVVSGRLQVRNYTDRDGNKRTATDIVADNVYFGDSRPKEGGDDAGYGAPAAPSDDFVPNFDDLEGELP